MQRRDVLKQTGAAVGAGLFAGCLSGSGDSPGAPGNGGDSNGTEGDGQESTTTTTTSKTTGDKPTALKKKSIEVVDVGCASGGSGVSMGGSENGSSTTDSSGGSANDSSGETTSKPSNGASVEFDAAEKKVVVTGTVITSDPCHVAELGKTEYDRRANELFVTVEAKRKEGADACVSCVGAIRYEATFTFDEGVPQSVQVAHRSQGKKETVEKANAQATTTGA